MAPLTNSAAKAHVWIAHTLSLPLLRRLSDESAKIDWTAQPGWFGLGLRPPLLPFTVN
jgi:hypothetical protein